MIPGLGVFGGGGLSVSPSSSTDARSGAGGGVGSHIFNIGANPNLAALGAGGIPWWMLAAAALALFLVLRRP